MNCEVLRTSTCGYLGKTLAPAERSAYEAHLAVCASCQRFLELARSTRCKDVADFLSDYLEGELSAEERAAFERHIRLCPPCVTYMRSLEATIEVGRSLCDEECPPVPEDLVAAILKSRRKG
jgi:anti-sigma factor RsiW